MNAEISHLGTFDHSEFQVENHEKIYTRIYMYKRKFYVAVGHSSNVNSESSYKSSFISLFFMGSKSNLKPIFHKRLVNSNEKNFHYIAFENDNFYFIDFEENSTKTINKINIETL